MSRRSKYGWEGLPLGEWTRVRSAPDSTFTQDSSTNARMRMAGASWADRHRLRFESRTERRGKELWVRFTQVDA